MPDDDTHIPVSEATRRRLDALKRLDEPYGDLLRALTQLRQRQNLIERLEDLEAADRDELTPLDEV